MEGVAPMVIKEGFSKKNALGRVTIIEYEKQDEKRRHRGSLYL